jgi:putative tricarboxylic transport membrane protein
MQRNQSVLAACLLFCAACAHAASAGWQPDKNLGIVVAATPGGGYDNLARPMQRILQERKLVDPAVVLVHKPGAGGALGWAYLNQRTNDGHIISIISGTILGAQIMGQSQLKYTDFTTLPMMFNEYIGFHVKADSPIRDGRDLVERLKKDPNSLSFSPGTSIGTLPHVAFALVLKKAGFTHDMRKMKVVAFNSTGESAIAVAGGHIDLLVTRPSNVAELVKGGRLRTLAVSSPTRMPSNPDVPTWKELGIDAVYGNWFGTIGPRGMTPQQVAWWDDTLARLTRHEDWRRELERNMWSDFYLSSKDARRFLDQQNVELRALMTDIGLAKQ